MNYKCFALEIANGIADLRLNRPESRNSMTRDFFQELPQVFGQLDEQQEVRVIVLSSTGPHFSSGIDLSLLQEVSSLSGTSRDSFRNLVRGLQDSFNCPERCRKPVIAAVQGGCIGAAVDLINAFDMRFATRSAYFTIHEIKLAIMADLGTLQRMPRLIPAGIVRELAYTGDKLSAERARACGFLNEIYENEDELMKNVMSIAARIASRSPQAVAATKEAITYARDHSIDDSLRQAADLQTVVFDENQIRECLKAEKEKREPVFSALGPTRIKP